MLKAVCSRSVSTRVGLKRLCVNWHQSASLAELSAHTNQHATLVHVFENYFSHLCVTVLGAGVHQ